MLDQFGSLLSISIGFMLCHCDVSMVSQLIIVVLIIVVAIMLCIHGNPYQHTSVVWQVKCWSLSGVTTPQETHDIKWSQQESYSMESIHRNNALIINSHCIDIVYIIYILLLNYYYYVCFYSTIRLMFCFTILYI